MVPQVLTPRVQDRQETDLGPEVPRIGSDLLQGLGRSAKEDAVDDAVVLESDRPERRWQGENDVEILNVPR
jgi:hypothetical protein